MSTKVRFDEKAIDGIFRDLDQSHLPGAAVGIAIDGAPIYRKGFGLASMELPVALTPQTRMRIYSVTKHFACLAYLLLCEEGKAGIDDAVGKYLPQLHPVTHRVTMRQLMSHTGGLRDVCDIRWFFSGLERAVSAPDLLAHYRDIQDVNFAPGESWCYNNGGYHILSAVIEKLEERPLEEVFRRRLFEPAEMSDSLLRRSDTDFVANSATMHTATPTGSYERRYLPAELVGEGGIVSTVDDVLRWLTYVASPRSKWAEMWTLMSTSQKLNSGIETGYGLGLFRQSYRGIEVIYHTGGGLGSNSQMIRVPDAKLDIVVSLNRHDVSAKMLATEVIDNCLSISRDRPTQEFSAIKGVFRSPRTGRCVQTYPKESGQMALIDGLEEWSLALWDGRALRPDPRYLCDLTLTCPDDQKPPDRLLYGQSGGADELLRVPSEPTPAVASISGSYRADSLGVGMTVTGEGDRGFARTAGRFGSASYPVTPLGPGLWRIGPSESIFWAGVLTVADDMSLSLRTPRSWSIALRRVA